MATPALISNGNSLHSADERTTAALAHSSAILNFFTGIGGPIAALIIWLTQKDKSPWVGFHALQSVVFQSIVMIIAVVVVGLVWVVGFAISFLSLGIGAILAVPVMILFFFAGFILVGAGGFYSLYGAYQVYQGKEFYYLWIGDWLKRRAG